MFSARNGPQNWAPDAPLPPKCAEFRPGAFGPGPGTKKSKKKSKYAQTLLGMIVVESSLDFSGGHQFRNQGRSISNCPRKFAFWFFHRSTVPQPRHVDIHRLSNMELHHFSHSTALHSGMSSSNFRTKCELPCVKVPNSHHAFSTVHRYLCIAINVGVSITSSFHTTLNVICARGRKQCKSDQVSSCKIIARVLLALFAARWVQ